MNRTRTKICREFTLKSKIYYIKSILYTATERARDKIQAIGTLNITRAHSSYK